MYLCPLQCNQPQPYNYEDGFGLDITRRGPILFETNSILILRRRDTIKPPKKEEINKPYEKRKKNYLAGMYYTTVNVLRFISTTTVEMSVRYKAVKDVQDVQPCCDAWGII